MGYSRYVGRVGALAVMLGVGTAVAPPAWAGDGPPGTGSTSSSSSSSGSPAHGSRHATKARTHAVAPRRAKADSDSGVDAAATSATSDSPGTRTSGKKAKKRTHTGAASVPDSALAAGVNPHLGVAVATAAAGPKPVAAQAPEPAALTPSAISATESSAPQSISLPAVAAPEAATAVAVSAALTTVAPLVAPGTDGPLASPAMWVLMAAARRQIGDTDTVSDKTAPQTTTGAPVAAVPIAAAPAAGTTTVTVSTWSQLISATGTYGGYIATPTAGTNDTSTPAPIDAISDTSWTLANTYVSALGAYQTTFTYTTPYSQNQTVQTQLQNAALGLHIPYVAGNYTAWLVAMPFDPANAGTDPTISGRKLTIGDQIDHPADMIIAYATADGGFAAGYPSTISNTNSRTLYYVAILPNNITPVFSGGDLTAPTAPTISTSRLTTSSAGLIASGSTDDVGVVGYNFYRVDTYTDYQGNPATTIWKANASVVPAGTAFTDAGVQSGTTYVYTARAVDAAGRESLDSASFTVTIPAPDSQPPTAPTLTAINVSATSVTLLPSGSTDNVGVVGYDIYRDDELLTIVKPVTPGQSYVDNTVVAGTTYSYYAVAVDAAANYSDDGTAIEVKTTGTDTGGNPGGPTTDVTPPTAPIIASSNVKSTTVGLTPKRGTATDDVGIVSYNIYNSGVLIASGVAEGETYTAQGLSPGKVYYFTARAVDAAGNVSVDSRSVRVETFKKNELPNLFNTVKKWFFKLASFIIPDKTTHNSILEVWWEASNNALSLVPGGGPVSAALSAPIDFIQLLVAMVQNDPDGVEDELKDLQRDGIHALEPLKRALQVLKWASKLL